MRLYITKLIGAGLFLAVSSQAMACGPGAAPSSAELLSFQGGIIDRGLKRETLTDAQRDEIATLRKTVEAAHASGKSIDAREPMRKIVAMFQMRELGGAVEPIATGCGPLPQKTTLKGVLKAIEIEPNVVGARCGNHYVLLVRLEGRGSKTEKVRIYDMAKAPYDKLKPMIGKAVEVETLGGTGVSAIHLAGSKPDAPTRLAGLKASKPCG